MIPKRKQALANEESSHDINSVDTSNDSVDDESVTENEAVRTGAVSGHEEFVTSSVSDNETFAAGRPTVSEHEECLAGISRDTDSKMTTNIVSDIATSDAS